MKTLKVVSFNLRCANDVDGINCYKYREEYLLSRIRREAPDVLGFQEMTMPMVTSLKQKLTDYTIVGCGRDADLRGEHCCIAYRTDTFELQTLDNFWLSDTPDVPASRFEGQSACPRVCTYVKLYHRESKQMMWFFNTHLDYIYAPPIQKGLLEVLKVAGECYDRQPLPLFITGDFNFSPEDGYYQSITECRFTDVSAGLPGTFHDFGREKNPARIDYVLTSLPREDVTTTLWHENHDGVYLSDHDAVCAVWKMEK